MTVQRARLELAVLPEEAAEHVPACQGRVEGGGAREREEG